MDPKVALSVVAVFLVSASCQDRQQRLLERAEVQLVQPDAEWMDPEFRVVSGESTILYLAEFGGVPLPDAMGGYELFVQVSSDVPLASGVTLPVPSDRVRAFLNLSSIGTESSDAVTGRITILQVNDSEITGELDLTSEPLRWQRTETVRFKRVPLRLYATSDWGVWKEGGGSWQSYATAVAFAVIGACAAAVLFVGGDPRFRFFARTVLAFVFVLGVILAFWKIFGLAVPLLYPLAVFLLLSSGFVLRLDPYFD